jgi:hypothetical protein
MATGVLKLVAYIAELEARLSPKEGGDGV